MAILINITDGVAVNKFICRKDTAKLIKATILPGLTSGFKKVATLPLHIHYDNRNGNIYCEFSKTSTMLSPQHLTTIERVIWPSKSCQWAGNPWPAIGVCCVGPTNISSGVTIHHGQCSNAKWEAKNGSKERAWLPFISVTHHMVPLMHCMIGIGKVPLKMLQNIINEFIKNMTFTEMTIRFLNLC